MKRLLTICFVFLIGVLKADDRITATVTVTNAPTTNHMTFVVNGDTRTWTNSVTLPASQILTNSDIEGVFTNLVQHLEATPPTRVSVYRDQDSTNVFKLQGVTGDPLVVSSSHSYFSVTYSTQAVTVAHTVRVPVTVENNAQRTNVADGLIDAINDYASGTFDAGAPALANFVDTSEDQLVGGAKVFTGATSLSNAVLELGTAAGGVVVKMYDPANGGYSNIFSITDTELTIEAPVLMSGGYFEFAGDMRQLSGGVTLNYGWDGSLLDITTTSSAQANARLGTVTATNALNVGGLVNITNNVTVHTNLTVSGNTTLASNTFHNGYQSFDMYANTALANGNNAAVALSDRSFVKVSGPSSAFAICGIAGGTEGRILHIINLTGFNMTFAHDSGVDPTAGNRIYTSTGSDVATTANGFATLIYSSADSRWILLNIEQ